MSAGNGTRCCLVVDDDPAIREILVTNLEAEGMDVRTADNGDDAGTLARELRPDLIVLDVMMPGRDGYAVLGDLKSDPATAEIPVVLLTAKAGEDDVWEGWKSGADYYITKPFSVDELMYFIDMAFGSSVA
jgi:two-component system phosphate regulon response regulator PhoB